LLANGGVWRTKEGLRALSITRGEKVGWQVELREETFLEWGPWMFNNHLLVFHILQEGEDPMVVSLFWSNFWVQIETFGEILPSQNRSWKKKLEFEWDLSIKVIPKRAMVESSPWIEYGGKLSSEFGDLENLDPNEELIEEDCPIETGEGKKRPRSTQFSSVSSRMGSGKLLMDMSLFMILRYRLALQGKVIRCNENLMLECPENGEPLGKMSYSAEWKQGARVVLRSFLLSYIDVSIEGETKGANWRFIRFYKHLLTMGDFNEIMYSHEKQWGRLSDEQGVMAFRSALEDCELVDLGYEGQWFTWDQGRLVHNNIQERLD
ncbi:hypothetical protein Golax_000066, partial [Gossypium laxum]|nr:hypothetical protein [Gossypium laxum]